MGGSTGGGGCTGWHCYPVPLPLPPYLPPPSPDAKATF